MSKSNHCRSFEDLVFKTLTTMEEFGTQPRPNLQISILLEIDLYLLLGNWKLSCSRHHPGCLRQYACCYIVLGPTDRCALFVCLLVCSFRHFATKTYKVVIESPPGDALQLFKTNGT